MQPLQLQPRFPDESGGVGSCSGSKTAVNKFDVFINHRGPDTKHTMAYHLYDLFQDRGVQVFLDKEELQGGDSMPVVIEEAITCCKVHVCIFSSRYAESAWCLKELEMILNRYEIGTSLLIPIFYDVEPSDVRYLKGTFGQGFEKHRCRYSSEVIEKWRDVLFKASNISGYEGKGELCMTIVNIVCKRLNAGSVATPEKVVGILDNVMKITDNIMRYRNECQHVTLIEVCGVGGIGKTTFAKCLYNQIYTQFQRHYFIEDVSGTIEKNGVDAVHRQLGNNLLRDDSTLCGSQLKQLLKERLQNADILLVLDNIIRENCLNVVFMDDYVDLAGTSVIIVTSREKDVVKHNPARYNLMSLQISELVYPESKEIFCYYAFGGMGRILSTQFDNLINKIISKCGGIPLALTLMGRQLYGRKIAFWENFWLAIKDSLPSDLKKILKFSYDSLETELEKCLFLDVAIFFHLESVGLLKKCRAKNDEDEAEILIALDNLSKKLLIDVRSGNLYMHDLLVDLCKSIVKDESSEPGHRSRLWNPLHVREVLSDNTGTDKVKGLSLVWKGEAVLDEDVNGDPCPWSAKAFAEMSSLEILILNGDCIKGDFSRLSKRLLFLKWTNFPLQSIPTTLCLKSLRVLLLSHGRNIRLWDFCQREAPVNLRQLMVLECNKLQTLPKFTRRFGNLSSIKFDGLISLESLPDSFGLLQGMKSLWLKNCMALKELPKSIGNLKHLLELIVQNSSELKLSSTSFQNLSQLELLTLVNCPALKELPQTMDALPNLRGFVIEKCGNLDISEQVTQYNLQRLRSLRVVEMSNLRKFSQLLGSLSRLEHLRLFDCDSLEEFPESLGNLSHLKYLYIGLCANLTALPVTVGNLKKLRMFCIQSCPQLKQLPSTLGNLSVLTLLVVSTCGRVEVIHTHQMFKLKYLFIVICGNLRRIDGIDGCLQSLESVCLTDCDQLHFPDGFLCQQHNFKYIRLSLNEEFITRYSYNDFKNLSDWIIPEINQYSMRYSLGGSIPNGYHYSVNAEVSPCLFPRLEERMRHIVANYTSIGAFLYSVNNHEQQQLPEGSYICIICFISAVYVRDFADKIGFPCFVFQPQLVGNDIVKGEADFYQFSIGEQINFGLSFVSTSGEGSQASFKIRPSNHVQRRFGHDYLVNKGIIKEGWMICVRKASHVASDMALAIDSDVASDSDPAVALVREVNRAFYSELQYQRLVSRAWSQLPSQLCLFKFSALDVANCKITKIYRHYNTWIMVRICFSFLLLPVYLVNFYHDYWYSRLTLTLNGKFIQKEKTALTWQRRKCLFSDDHALALLALPRNRKNFTFLVFNASKYELQNVTNFYEMSIFILLRGKINHTRKLQQNVSNSTKDKEIPHGLDTLLKSKSHDVRVKAFDCRRDDKSRYIFENDVYVQVKGGFSEGWKKYPWHY